MTVSYVAIEVKSTGICSVSFPFFRNTIFKTEKSNNHLSQQSINLKCVRYCANYAMSVSVNTYSVATAKTFNHTRFTLKLINKRLLYIEKVSQSLRHATT